MKVPVQITLALAVILMDPGSLAISQAALPEPAPAQLELTSEVAATTVDGYPAALRATLKNVGNGDVYMPLPSPGCIPDNGLNLRARWIPDDDPSKGEGIGGGCGSSDGKTLRQRVEENWIRLRPGEYMTTTLSLRGEINSLGPGTLEYWVEYTSPQATREEIADLHQSGYVIPTEKLQTQHQSFKIH